MRVASNGSADEKVLENCEPWLMKNVVHGGFLDQEGYRGCRQFLAFCLDLCLEISNVEVRSWHRAVLHNESDSVK